MSPLTLTVSWAALKRGTRSSTATRLGVAFNLFLVIAGLGVLTTVWGWSAADGLLLLWIAWGLLVAILLAWFRTLYKRKQPQAVRSGDDPRVL
jgi:4-hydroxybenzoate polyprenyltransferase